MDRTFSDHNKHNCGKTERCYGQCGLLCNLWNVCWWRNDMNNASTDGTNLRQKASHIAACLGICNRTRCLWNSIRWNVPTIEEQKTDHCKKFEVMTHDISNTNETGLFFKVQPHKTLSFWGAPCHGGARLNTALLTASSIQPLHLHIIWAPLQKAANFNCCSHDW